MTGSPVIGIVVGRSPVERYSTHQGYVASITAAGGVPVLLPAGRFPDDQGRGFQAALGEYQVARGVAQGAAVECGQRVRTNMGR